MKVVFLVQGMHVAASRYRVLQYLLIFRAAGIDTEVFEFPQRMAGWSSLWEFLKKGTSFLSRESAFPLSPFIFKTSKKENTL